MRGLCHWSVQHTTIIVELQLAMIKNTELCLTGSSFVQPDEVPSPASSGDHPGNLAVATDELYQQQKIP